MPFCDPSGLIYNGDGTGGIQLWMYVSRKHTERDMLRPGFFDSARDSGMRKWDQISYTVGGPEPCDARRGIIVVELSPGGRGVSIETPTTVAIVTRYGKPTPSRHDGGALEQ